MLAHQLRRWQNMKPTNNQRLVLLGDLDVSELIGPDLDSNERDKK